MRTGKPGVLQINIVLATFIRKIIHMGSKLLAYFDDFISLIYPRLCYACGNSLFLNEEILCTRCQMSLPLTGSHLTAENPVSKVFWGRMTVEAAAARYFFRKGNNIQHLLHNLKYRNVPEIGIFIGRMYGTELMENEVFRSVDVIIPVPLHKDKQKKRGYNQAGVFARGLGLGMHKPVDEVSLYRTYFTESQTRKSRFSRWENVKMVFAVKEGSQLEGKHILLVDDVITTGATLEGCASKLMDLPDVKISIAAIAVAARVV